MELAHQLRILMNRDNVSAAKLAERTGISVKTIYHYLEGRSPRNLGHIRKICECFGVSSDYLLFGLEAKVLNQDIIPFGHYDVFLKRRE